MKPKPKPKLKRGLALCSEADKRRVSSAGGRAVARKRGHMKRIGRKGGRAPHKPASTLRTYTGRVLMKI